MNAEFLTVPLSFIVASSGVFWLCCRLSTHQRALHDGLKNLYRSHRPDGLDHTGASLFRSNFVNAMNAPKSNQRMRCALEQAGVQGAKSILAFRIAKLLCLGAALPLCLCVWQFTLVTPNRIWALSALTGAIMLFYAPQLWLSRAIKHRAAMFRRSIPDFIDLTVVCLDAGLTFRDSIRRVSDELRAVHPALVGELLTVQRDVELGTSLAGALAGFAERTNSEGAKVLAHLMKEASKYGTDITESLRSHSDSLRSQRELAAEELAQRASVKVILPVVLCILPAIFVVIAGPAFMHLDLAFGQTKEASTCSHKPTLPDSSSQGLVSR